MSGGSAWDERPLVSLLNSMESGSRPRGGVRGIVDGVPSLGGEHLNSLGGFNFDNVKYVPPSFYNSMRRGHITRGDVLVVKDGATTGKVALVRDDFPFEQAVANEHLFVCRPKSVNPEYLFWYLYSDEGKRRILEHFKGSAQGGITRDFAEGTRVPVAPQELQDRLAPLLRTAFDYRLSAEAHLASARHAIERFRQAVLAAACSGRLTADWRRTIGPLDGSASETTEHPNMPNVPGTWSYRRLDEIVAPGAAISYGIVLPGQEIPDGVPYVRQQDVAEGTVLVDQLRRTRPEIAAKHERSSLRQGDILLCIIRNLRVAIVPAGLDGANITQGMVRIRPGHEVVSEYLAAYLKSRHAQRWMTDQYIGLAMPRINVADARAIPIPLPPFDEQVEIVSRLGSMLSFADTLERRLTVAADRVGHSSRSILAKAFRGELIGAES